MLDKFLEVAYEHDQRTSMRNEMAAGFKHLPIDELAKIASGELKLANYDEGDWLDKFKGSPLYDQALGLEEECLRIDIAEQQHRGQERSMSEQLWNAKDAIRLKKRMLELQLRQSESAPQQAPGGPAMEAATPPTGEAPMATEGAPAGAPMEGGAPKVASPQQIQKLIAESLTEGAKSKGTKDLVRKAGGIVHSTSPFGTVRVASGEDEDKTAAELTQAGREHIKSKNFAIPKGDGPGDTGKYPIHDEEHARNALTRVRTFGTPEEKSKVYAAVAKKYPGLAARSSVEGVQEKVKKEKDSCMKTAAPMPRMSSADLLRNLALGVLVPGVIGAGAGAAGAPAGSGGEGALRGGAGAAGGNILGGTLGALGGGALGAGLGGLAGGSEAALIGALLGGSLGNLGGGVYGGVKGYRAAMKPLHEKKKESSVVDPDVLASMRMAALVKSANVAGTIAEGAHEVAAAAPGIRQGVTNMFNRLVGRAGGAGKAVSEAVRPTTEAVGNIAGHVGEALQGAAGRVGAMGKEVGEGVAHGAQQAAKPLQTLAGDVQAARELGDPSLIPGLVGQAVGTVAPHLGTGAVGYGLGHTMGHAAGMEAGRAAMEPELQKKLLLGLGGGALGGAGLTAAAMGGGQKTAGAELDSLSVADIWGREMAQQMVKEGVNPAGVLGTAWKGLKSGLGYLKGTPTAIAQNIGKGRWANAGNLIKNTATEGLGHAANWAAKNPLAAGALGAGAVGGTALAAGGAGHMMGSR